MSLIYDYRVTNGMYYIVEHSDPDSLPETVVDEEGREWTYEKTYMNTILAIFALNRIGAIAVLFNTSLKRAELRTLVRNTDVELLLKRCKGIKPRGKSILR